MFLHIIKICDNKVVSCMKKHLIWLFALTLLLPACTRGDADKYNTPEKFLSHVEQTNEYCTIHSSEVDFSYVDVGLVVKNEILKIDSFTKTKNFTPSTHRRMSYELLIHFSTSGTNYSNLYIYEDGSTKIVYKPALGKISNFYFTCDPEQALALNNFVEEYLIQKQSDDAMAKEIGEAGATVENFFTFMEEQDSANVNLVVDLYLEDFIDDGELLNTIKNIKFTRVDEPMYGFHLLEYFTHREEYEPDAPKPFWNFVLFDTYTNARIGYTFIYKEVTYSFYGYYTFSASEGHLIENKALELFRTK